MLFSKPDSFLQGFPDGLNLNQLCVRGTKNARGDYKVSGTARSFGPLHSVTAFFFLNFPFYAFIHHAALFED